MRSVKFLSASALVALLASCGQGAAEQAATEDFVSATGPVEVNYAIQADVSPRLRDLPARQAGRQDKQEKKRKEIPAGHAVNDRDDGALQAAPGPLLGTTPLLNFAGVGEGDYGFTDQYAPPDTNGAVGQTQYVQWVNVNFAVFNKATGALVYGPAAGNTLWTGFGGDCETTNDGDPIVQYDKVANRWIMTQFAVSAQPYLQCVAVSQTPDALGAYNRYAFAYANAFNDYPKLGVWPDGYYITYNIFTNGQTFAGSRVCAFDSAAMIAGAAATQQCFQLSSSFGGLLPSDVDGAAPPAGSPAFFLNFGSNSLRLWKMQTDWATPANTTLTGPTTIPVTSFSAACSGGGNCIPQPGTSQKLDSLADRLMYRLAYRNFGTHESLVVNHSVNAGGKGKRNSITGVRWYEIRNPNGTPAVFQQGTFAPDATSRWMGSIAMDKQGNIALGYSASSSSVFPGIRYTGRLATDPLGTMGSENLILSGGGSQLPNLARWGDYSSMVVDPSDDCTFWFTTEYLKTSGTFNWSTRIASFKFPGCI